MKRILLLSIFLPALSLLTISVGCTKKQSETESDRPKEKFVAGREKAGAGTAAARTPLKAGDGVIKGRVVFQGEKPKMAIIDKMASHNDAKVCLAGSEQEKEDQKWIIGQDDGVANVVIFLKAPAGKYFEAKDEDKKLAGKKVVIDQPHCAFVPHVVAAFPSFYDGKTFQPTGEQFVVKNSAPINHNTNWKGDPLKTGGGNRTLKTNEELDLKLVPESNPIQVSCDIHPWMYGRIWAFEHPYFAVTQSDGKFEIKNVPTGIDIGLVGWHEAKDYFLAGGKEGTKKKFNAGENKEDLTISAK